MKIPEPQNNISNLIDIAYERQQEPPRPHMGASEIGHHCERWLWLKFRWAVIENFNGRLLRLFKRGQMEESTIVQNLRMIGIKINATGGEQSRVKFGCHVSGSLDGIIEYGVPEAPTKRHVAEFKTHSKKSFETLLKEGVEKAKFQHFIQMQIYMHGTKIDRALYLAVCKDDDRLYTERVRYDKAIAEKYLARGQRIAMSEEMPPPISTNASWYQCKFCAAYSFCHEKQLTQEVNCRTCAYAVAKQDDTWSCNRYDANNIPTEFQRKGCDGHVLHPDLTPWEVKGVSVVDDKDAVYLINGREVVNGLAGYKSAELIANADLCATGDEFVQALRSEFDGKIVG